jgi:hypothetical protein
MATNLQFTITLEPVGYDNRWPEFNLKLDNELQDFGTINEERTYNFDVTLDDGAHTISIELLNKADNDTIVVNDKIVNDLALIVKKVTIEGYDFDSFLYNAVYKPTGREQSNSSYLSWNGTWELDFSTPIFTWLHQTQHLGWIYEKNL